MAVNSFEKQVALALQRTVEEKYFVFFFSRQNDKNLFKIQDFHQHFAKISFFLHSNSIEFAKIILF